MFGDSDWRIKILATVSILTGFLILFICLCVMLIRHHSKKQRGPSVSLTWRDSNPWRLFVIYQKIFRVFSLEKIIFIQNQVMFNFLQEENIMEYNQKKNKEIQILCVNALQTKTLHRTQGRTQGVPCVQILPCKYPVIVTFVL